MATLLLSVPLTGALAFTSGFDRDAGFRSASCDGSIRLSQGLLDWAFGLLDCGASAVPMVKVLGLLLSVAALTAITQHLRSTESRFVALATALVLGLHPTVNVGATSDLVVPVALVAVSIHLAWQSRFAGLFVGLLAPFLGIWRALRNPTTQELPALVGALAGLLPTVGIGGAVQPRLEGYWDTFPYLPGIDILVVTFLAARQSEHRGPMIGLGVAMVIGHVVRDPEGWTSLAMSPSLLLLLFVARESFSFLEEFSEPVRRGALLVVALAGGIGVYQLALARPERGQYLLAVAELVAARTSDAPTCVVASPFPGAVDLKSQCLSLPFDSARPVDIAIFPATTSFSAVHEQGAPVLPDKSTYRGQHSQVPLILSECSATGAFEVSAGPFSKCEPPP